MGSRMNTKDPPGGIQRDACQTMSLASSRGKCALVLTVNATNDVEDQRKQHTQQDAGGNREIEGGMFAAPGNISRQTPEWQIQLSRDQNTDSGERDQNADSDQSSPESVHNSSVEPVFSLFEVQASRPVRFANPATL